VAIDGLLLRKRWSRAIVDIAPLLLITAAGMVVARVAQTVAVFQHVPLWQRPLIVGDSLTFYLGKLAWPATLSPDYGRTPTVALADPWVYVRWLVPAAIAAALLVWHRRVPWLAAAFALFVIGVAPVSGIATFQMQAISTVTDHYLYFSVLGLAVALTWVVSRWPRQWVTATACALLAALAARSFVQTGIWRDAFALFEGTIRAHPRSTMARLNLVVCYLTKLTPEPEVAARYADEAYAIAPDDIIVLINYGVTRMAAGELDKAPAAFERAWQNAKSLDAAPKLLSDITKSAFETFRATTYHDEVVKWAERRLELEPGDANALVALGDARQAIAATRPTTGTTTGAPAPGPASRRSPAAHR
ncbi:MAG: tetratricopeptide repeat protein, partial [Variovorax sp.]